jgi:hypothetical protein
LAVIGKPDVQKYQNTGSFVNIKSPVDLIAKGFWRGGRGIFGLRSKSAYAIE